MSKRFFFFVFSVTAVGFLYAQKESKADRLYYEYAYSQAVEAYEKERAKNGLTLEQELHLADAYFRTGRYDKSSAVFMEVYKKDSLMTNAQFNTMLQSLSKTSGPDRVQAFLNTRSDQVSEALLINADFNYETLGDLGLTIGEYTIFKPNINSPQSDFAPSFYGEERILFTSGRPSDLKETYDPSGESYLSIFSVSITEKNAAVRPGPLTWVPRIPYHQATPFYSEALNEVFYVQSNMDEDVLAFDSNGKNTLAIFRSDESGFFQPLFRDLSTSFYYPYYHEASGRLYFAADFGTGYGGTDLYYVSSNNGQIMSEPINLGPHINTPGNEIAPFIFDGSLYFSSDVFYGLGGMDIYKSEVQGGEFFSIPVNLGPGINSNKDDFGFIVRKEQGGGYYGYFASNRPGGLGKDDVYGFRSEEKPGLKTLALRGTIRDTDGFAIEKAFVRLFEGDSLQLKETYTDRDGDFLLEIPWRDSVRIEIGKERYEILSLGNSATDETLKTGEPFMLTLTPIKSIVLQQANRTLLKTDVFHFQRNSKTLTPEITAILDEAALQLRKFPELRLRLEAHTDSRGYKNTNQKLSEGRATAIRDYLIAQGVAPEVFAEVKGLGETQIINNCSDGVYCLDVLHKQNERYLFVVLNYDEL